jgi:purine nucleosidase
MLDQICHQFIQMKLWIDTDAGADDATAILIALNAPDVELVGISCLTGNTFLPNVLRNVNRILNVWGDSTHIPIYAGCDHAIICPPRPAPQVHGEDGLGNFDDAGYGIDQVPLRVEKEHAVNALILAAQQYGSDLVVLAIGPLTNLALAARMNPTAMTSIGKLVIMGGSETGVGNTTPWAEYNFRLDPEAAHIVLEVFPPKIVYLSSWQLTLNYVLPRTLIGSGQTVIERFLQDTWKICLEFTKGDLLLADPIAAFVTCYPDRVQSKQMEISIVRDGEKIGASEAVDVSEGGISVVTTIDLDFFKEIFARLRAHH